MSRTVTLAQLRTDIGFQADVVMGTTGRYTTAMVNRFINQSIQRFRERVSQEGIQHYLVASPGTLSAGNTSPYPFAVLDCTSFSPGVVRVYGVDITFNSITKSLLHRPFTERAMFGGPDVLGEPERWANYQTTKLAIMPGPLYDYSYLVWYLPVATDLSSDSDTFDGVAGWEDYIVWDVVCRLINRDQYGPAFVTASKQRDEVWADILRSATRVSAAGGAVIGRDVFARIAPRKWDIGGGGISAHSVTNSMLATMAAGFIKGRAATAGTGDVQDLSGAQVNEILPKFAGAAAGLVPTGPGSSAYFLAGDGSWTIPAGGGGGGGNPGGPTLALQFNAGSGVFGGMTGVKMQGSGLGLNAVGITAASLSAPLFSSARAGLVPTATSANLFLRDDGTWAGVPSFAVSGGGGGPTMLAAGPAQAVQFNGGSGFAGVSGLMYAAGSGLTVWDGVRLPTGTIALGATGNPQIPQAFIGGGATGGIYFATERADLESIWIKNGSKESAPNQLKILVREDSGYGKPVPLLNVLRTATGGVAYKYGDDNAVDYNEFFALNNFDSRVTSPTGTVTSWIGNNLVYRQAPDFAQWLASGTQMVYRARGLTVPGLVNREITFPTALGDKLAAWQSSGIANIATGIAVVGSGMGLYAGGLTTASLSAPIFGANAGLVPTSSSAGLFLRDDGTWQTPAAGGGGGGSTPGLPTLSIQFNNGSGIMAGATGVKVTPSGLGLNMVGLTTASLSAPLFSSAQAGLVPTSTSVGNFLKDDGTWATPGGGGGGPTMLAAAPAGSVQYNSGSGFGGASGLVWENPSGFALSAPMRVASGAFFTYGSGWTTNVSRGMHRIDTGVFLAASVSGITEDILRYGTVAPGEFTVGGGLNTVRVNNRTGSSTTAEHSWEVGTGNRKAGLNFQQFWLQPGVQLGLQQLTHSASTDKLGAWTASGYANTATGITVVGSGLGLSTVGLTTASLSAPLFSSARAGLVPTATSANNFLRDDGVWAAPSVAGSVTGVTNSQLAFAPPNTIKGNNTTATGTILDLTTQQVASMLGLVALPSTAPAGLFLSDDGTFKGVPSNIPTGIGLSQELPMPPFSFRANPSGASGGPANITFLQAASMLPNFFATGTSRGLVFAPTGGVTGQFLKDDGSWGTPAGGNATGVANSQQLPMPPLTFKANFSGVSGFPQDIDKRTAASLLPVFYASGGSPGLVTTPTFGPSGYYLRDDGTWQELLRNNIDEGNVGSGATVGSYTVDFNKGPFHKIKLFGNTKISLAPPSGIHRHTQLQVTIGASGLSPTFFPSMVRFIGGSGGIPTLTAASGSSQIYSFFHDGSQMFCSYGDWGTSP